MGKETASGGGRVGQKCYMIKAKFKENEIGIRKQNGLEQQKPTAREAGRQGRRCDHSADCENEHKVFPLHSDPPIKRQFVYPSTTGYGGRGITNGPSAKVT